RAGYGGVKMQKSGNEHWLLMPESGQTNISGGEYYLAVASEGQNPNGNNIGSGSSSYTLGSLGPLPVVDLGTLNSTALVTNVAVDGGEVAAYRFAVGPGVLTLQTRLENRAGNPGMDLRAGTDLPQVGSQAGYGYGSSYGNWGGQSSVSSDYNLLTV